MIQNEPEAEKTRQAGQQAARSAMNDARGELRCANCGMKSQRSDCPRCDDDPDNGDDDGEPQRRDRRTAVEEMAERHKHESRF